MPVKPNIEEIVGQRFENMVVEAFDHTERRQRSDRERILYYYRCKCDCGKIFISEKSDIKRGKVVSCGCYHKKKFIDNLAGNKYREKHGMSGTRFYRTYKLIKRRCYGINSDHYPNYGGRGIKVCDRWLGEDGFIHFKEDMYESYLKHVEEYGEANTTIDRINVNEDYCPANCRWATWGEQAYNKRNCRYELHDHNTCKNIIDSAKNIVDPSIDSDILYDRLNGGWSLSKALIVPKNYNDTVINPISFSDSNKYKYPFTFRDGRNSGDGD